MKIKRINIRNYKSMYSSGDIEIDREIYAFIGQNNTGKSTILDAIQCVFPNSTKKVDLRDFHNKNENVIIELEFSEVTKNYIADKMFEEIQEKNRNEVENLKAEGKTEQKIEQKSKILTEKLDKKIEDTIAKYEIQNESMIIRVIVPYLGKKHNETRNSTNIISDADLKKILPDLKVIPAIRNPQNESTAGNNSYMKDLIKMLDDSIETSIEFGNEKISYNRLNEILADESTKRCDKLSQKITEKYSESIGSEDIRIKITSNVNISKGTSYSTKIIDKFTELESDMTNCGTGYQSMLILSILETYVDIANRKNNYILLIEEPEVYLHPSLQRRMIKTLVELSKDNQVIFSTHSAITISCLGKNQISLITKNKGRASINMIDVNKVIDELGIRPDDIMLKQGVILVEGPDDKVVVEEILRKISDKSLDKIDVVESGSCSNLKFYANAQRILSTVYSPELLIIRDADCKTPEKQKELLVEEINNLNRNSQKAIDDCIYIIGKHSLESLYMQPEIWSEECEIEFDKCKDIFELYNRIYDKMKKSGISEQEFAKIYQPKYFLEKNIDKYGCGDARSEERKKWDGNYYKKWEKAFEDINETEKFITFNEVREKINLYTSGKKQEKKDYLLEIVKNMKLEQLENNLFSGLIDKLEKFVEKVLN